MKDKYFKCNFKYILISSLVIFTIGAITHFLYEFLGKILIVGLLVPANESIWEHCKMILLPNVIWWVGYYKFNKNTNTINKDKFFTAMIVSILVSLIEIPMLYYFYTGILGKEIFIIDMIILYLALIIGQTLACHYYSRCDRALNIYLSIGIVIFLVLIFALFTIYPPKLPLFMDIQTKRYGI